MVSCADHSGKWDKELFYTIGKSITTAYIGRSIPQKAIENNFKGLSDDRITELSHHDVARDNICCPHCEKQLGKFLESQFSVYICQGKTVPSDVSCFFWL